MAISPQKAKSILEPLTPRLVSCVDAAFNEFDEIPSRLRVKLNSRAVANVINAFMVANVRNDLDGVREVEVRFLSKRGLFCVLVAGQVLLKFKKLDGNLRPSNIQTRQSQSYNDQGSLFPDLPPVSNLIVGYQVDELGRPKPGIIITCPNGRGNEWYFEVAPEVAQVVLLPAASPTTEESPRRVVIKNASMKNSVGE